MECPYSQDLSDFVGIFKMKDLFLNEIEEGDHVVIFSGIYPHGKDEGVFEVKQDSQGRTIFENDLYVAFKKDLKDLNLSFYKVVQCSECDKWEEERDIGVCKACNGNVCQDCQQPMTIHNQVDFSIHRTCWEWGYD